MELKKDVPLNRGGFKRLWSRGRKRSLAVTALAVIISVVISKARWILFKSPPFRNSAILIITVCHHILSLSHFISIHSRTIIPEGNINQQNRIKANDLPTKSLYTIYICSVGIFYAHTHTHYICLYYYFKQIKLVFYYPSFSSPWSLHCIYLEIIMSSKLLAQTREFYI